MKDWSAVFIVAARTGSQRLPGKNLVNIAGRPLLSYTADAVRESGLPYPVLLTTDSQEIMAVGRSLDWLVPFRRPAELATSSVPVINAVIHAIDWIKSSGEDPELVMLLQPTSPLRSGAVIRDAFGLLAEKQNANSVLSVLMDPEVKSADAHNDETVTPPGVTASSEGSGVWAPNGAIYLVRTSALRETRDLSASPTLLLEMSEEQSIDIDTEDDFRTAEQLLSRRPSLSD